ncbi:uncharacterized protein LOC108588084 isoform X3 [Callithrix jacchus]
MAEEVSALMKATVLMRQPGRVQEIVGALRKGSGDQLQEELATLLTHVAIALQEPAGDRRMQILHFLRWPVGWVSRALGCRRGPTLPALPCTLS